MAEARGEEMITDAALERAFQHLRKASAGNRRLHAAAARLLTDLVAVASGLRSAFMLDYATMPPAALAEMVASTMRALHATASLCVAVCQDCCLVANAGALPSGAPRFICFAPSAADGGAVAAQWAGQAQSAALHEQLETVRTALVEAAGGGGGSAVAVVDLDKLPHGLCMPTLMGCLLGYPAVYAVYSLDEAQAASRSLSCTTLRLVTASVALGSSEWHGGDPAASGEAPLLGFSLPVHLARDEAWGEALARWERSMQQRQTTAVKAGFPWRQLRVEQTSCMRGVAL